MKRLLKKAEEYEDHLEDEKELNEEAEFDVQGAKNSVEALNNTVKEMFEQYKKLFNQLNSLYKEYPSLYDEMKKIVRFPTEDTAKDITNMKNDLEVLSEHYQDTQYLSQIMDIFKQ